MRKRIRLWIIFAAVFFIAVYAISEVERGRAVFNERVTSVNIAFESLVEKRIQSIRVGWFVWDDMVHALENIDRDGLDEYADELEKMFGVKGLRIEDTVKDILIFGRNSVPEETTSPFIFRAENGSLAGVFDIRIQDGEWRDSPFTVRLLVDIGDIETMLLPLLSDLPDMRFDVMSHGANGVPLFKNSYIARTPSPFDILGKNISSVVFICALMAVIAFLAMFLLEFVYERMSVEGKLALLSNTLETRDGYSLGHTSRVAKYADVLAAELGLSKRRRKKLRIACLCHDLGKLVVPVSILDKAGELSPDERAIIERHPEAGRDIFKGVVSDPIVEDIVLRHHERWDGKGYPGGLSGEDVILEARILAVADTLDAITSERSYRTAKFPSEAYDIIEENSGTQFDPSIASLVRKVQVDIF